MCETSLYGGRGMLSDEKEREVAELIARVWRLIEYAEQRLRDPSLGESEKIRWAGVLATVYGTLNKLMWKAGVGRVDKQSFARLMAKIPKKYREIVYGRVKKCYVQ